MKDYLSPEITPWLERTMRQLPEKEKRGQKSTCVVLISADAEWEAAARNFPGSSINQTPFGRYFESRYKDWKIIYCQGGWGKVSAAASTQYAISTWQPDLVVNLGTCGGFAGRINQGEIILAARTSIYDIVEKMGDMKAALDFYTVAADLSWLPGPFPHPVRQEILVSADQDLNPGMSIQARSIM